MSGKGCIPDCAPECQGVAPAPTRGNDEVEAQYAKIMRLAYKYAIAFADNAGVPDSALIPYQDALDAAVRKALGLTAQTSVDQTPATMVGSLSGFI